MPALLSVLASLSLIDFFNILFILLIFYVLRFYIDYFARENPLPGPFPLPLIGSLYQAQGEMKHWENWYLHLHKKYGDIFEVWFGPTRKIFLSKSGLIEKLAAKSTKSNFLLRYSSGSYKGLEHYANPRRGMFFNGNISHWRSTRKVIDNLLMSPNYQRETLKKSQIYFAEMEEYWKLLRNDNALLLSAWAKNFLTDLMYDLNVGRRCYFMVKYFNSLANSGKKEIPTEELNFCNDHEQATSVIGEALIFFFTSPELVWRYLFAHRTQRYIQSRETWHRSYEKFIHQRLDQRAQSGYDSKLKPDALNLLLDLKEESALNNKDNGGDNYRMDEEDIRDSLQEIMNASASTTAGVFGYIIEYIGRIPGVKEQVEKEIRDHASSKTNTINIEEFAQFKYIEAVIYEVLRVRSAFMIERTNTQEETIGGYKWKPGTKFCVNIQPIHFNPDIWHDPNEFRPERFLNREIKNPKTYLSFGLGLRSCPGRLVGITILKAMTVLLYRKYNVELLDTDMPIKYQNKFANACIGARVKLTPKK
ncbi:165_t:CDS:2 [Ambispora leptoticha]|uniref:165_t:CDS:1 n=1 Tax=Ambispora leptoticha TaxID=144679 RepID=A0A9N9CKM3_9GLOM|nr:165_t:CDS:2 [Ambispora leptoticha]